MRFNSAFKELTQVMEFCWATSPIFAIILTESRFKNPGIQIVVSPCSDSLVLVQFKIICVPVMCYIITLEDSLNLNVVKICRGRILTGVDKKYKGTLVRSYVV